MYDCLIIGGGLSGLTCGIKCAKDGLRTAIISGGMNSLHFSSGSIDFLGYTAGNEVVQNPFKYIKKLRRKFRDHPYAKIPVTVIKDSLDFIKEELSQENLNLYNNGKRNHFRITALGVSKPTYMSQESVFNEELKQAVEDNIEIAVLNFEGFRDYYPELAVYQLEKNDFFKNVKFKTGNISLSFLPKTEKYLLESNSIDIARLFETEKYLPPLAKEIKEAAGKARIVSLPAFVGLNNNHRIHKRLSVLTGLHIYEVPTLPPSLLGMRIDNALKSRYASLGGEYIAGDKVTGGEIINGRVDHIRMLNFSDAKHRSKYYVLSTGSFFSNGLRSGFNKMYEPIFRLQFNWKRKRNKWASTKFFGQQSHPFLSFGVNTNKYLNPYERNWNVIRNLFCTGAVLSGYDPVKEGSGGGVAISTAFYAAQQIVKQIKKGK